MGIWRWGEVGRGSTIRAHAKYVHSRSVLGQAKLTGVDNDMGVAVSWPSRLERDGEGKEGIIEPFAVFVQGKLVGFFEEEGFGEALAYEAYGVMEERYSGVIFAFRCTCCI